MQSKQNFCISNSVKIAISGFCQDVPVSFKWMARNVEIKTAISFKTVYFRYLFWNQPTGIRFTCMDIQPEPKDAAGFYLSYTASRSPTRHRKAKEFYTNSSPRKIRFMRKSRELFRCLKTLVILSLPESRNTTRYALKDVI